MEKYLFIESLVANLPQFIFLSIALLIFIKNGKENSTLFLIGLLTVVFADFLVGPYSSWLAINYMEQIGASGLFISLATIPMSILKAIGLSICTFAFLKRRRLREDNE